MIFLTRPEGLTQGGKRSSSQEAESPINLFPSPKPIVAATAWRIVDMGEPAPKFGE